MLLESSINLLWYSIGYNIIHTAKRQTTISAKLSYPDDVMRNFVHDRVCFIDLSSSVQHMAQSETVGEGSQEGFQHVV